MPAPRISIITPCLNAAATVEQALRSVLDQGYEVLEYIVIDGGSTDGTREIIEKYRGRLAAFVCEKDRGISDAFNKGIDRATGDIIGILNADDFHQPTTLATVAAHWDANKPMTILHGDMNILHGSTVRRFRPRRWPGAIYFDMPAYHPTCFVGRQVYEKVGRYDLSYRCAMDFDLLVRARQAGASLVYVPQVLANFRWGGVASQRALTAHQEVFRSQRAHGLPWAPCAVSYAAKVTVNRLKACLRPARPSQVTP